jgi:hypothetical protein
LLSFLVNRIIRSLRVRGGTSGQILKVMKIALSERIAFIEQFLLYLAAVADWEVFKFAAGGWLVFKVVNKYAIWQPAKDEPDHELWAERRRYLHTAAIAHNRFQILP